MQPHKVIRDDPNIQNFGLWSMDHQNIYNWSNKWIWKKITLIKNSILGKTIENLREIVNKKFADNEYRHDQHLQEV